MANCFGVRSGWKQSNVLHLALTVQMFDPLSESATPFASETPSWKLPHEPSPLVPDAAPATSPLPPSTPLKSPSDGLYGKEPQIYGQPEPGLISPRETVASNGTKFEKAEPYLRVRITGLDRNRRDILVRLDAQVSAKEPNS